VTLAPTSDPAPAPPDGTVAPVVDLRGVSRRFGTVDALLDLDLSVPSGTITVLLGPNGAGKTTATRIITGALEPHHGEVRVFGLDPATHGEEVRRRCGVVSAKPALYDRLTGHANLAYSAELYGLGRGPGVDERTRLALARSVLHDPQLLLFDEPTSGLDPESSHAVLEMIKSMAGGGVTVIMCTHLLLEAEGLAQQVVVLEGGTDLVAGAPRELTRRFWPASVVRLDAEDRSQLARVVGMPGVRDAETVGDGLKELAGMVGDGIDAPLGSGPVDVQLEDPDGVADLVEALVRSGVRLTRVEPRIPTLEDLYFAVRRSRAQSHTVLADDGGRQLTPTSNGAGS